MNLKKIFDEVRRPAKPKRTRTAVGNPARDIESKMRSAIQECFEKTQSFFEGEDVFCDLNAVEFSEDGFSVEIPFDIPDLETEGSVVYYIYNEIPLLNGETDEIQVKASYYDQYGQNMFDYLSATQGAPLGYQHNFTIDGAVSKVREAIESAIATASEDINF